MTGTVASDSALTPWRARVAIVDDEPIARRGIRNLLRERADVDVVAECANGDDAISMIRDMKPDLVFLDVQMPGVNGFDVVRLVGAHDMPCVIFVTAFDEYAVAAFAIAAIDYIVKPFSPERLFTATDRALWRVREQRVVAAHEHLLRTLGDVPFASVQSSSPLQASTVTPASHDAASSGLAYAQRILVSIGTRSVVVLVERVTRFEADGDHVRVCVDNGAYTLRESLRELELRLNPAEFLRVHRSAIIRLSSVTSIERLEHDRLVLVLADQTKMPVSRGRRDVVLRTLGSIRG